MLSPALYHAHHIQHMEDLPFWEALARQAEPPLLELGCGTGRILLALASIGMRLTGLDRDPAGLAYLQDRLHANPTNGIELVQADMIDFTLSQRFGLVFLACNTLSTLPPEQRRSLYEGTFEHLLPGGLFAASIPNPELLIRLPKTSDAEIEEIFYHPESGDPVQVSSAWSRLGDQITFTWYYDQLFADGGVERQQTQVTHYMQPKSSYLEGLQAAGFQGIQLFGNFTKTPYRKSSPYLILIAQAL